MAPKNAERQEGLLNEEAAGQEALHHALVVHQHLHRLPHLRVGQRLVTQVQAHVEGVGGLGKDSTLMSALPASGLIWSGVRSRAKSTSPFSSSRRCEAGSGTWRTTTRFSCGAPRRKPGLASRLTLSLAFHESSLNGAGGRRVGLQPGVAEVAVGLVAPAPPSSRPPRRRRRPSGSAPGRGRNPR